MRLVSCVVDLCESQELQHPDVQPADVEFKPARSKPRRLWICMVVVVKLFAAEPNGDWRDVAAFVLDLVVAIAKRVAHTIHDARSPEWDPQHLHAPHDRS